MNKPAEVSAVEDLMREHGLLDRLLLIYEEVIRRLKSNIDFDNRILPAVVYIVRKFVEEYHEPTEEKYVFPLLIKKGVCVDMVNELIRQHQVSRQITNKIIQLLSSDSEKKSLDYKVKLIKLIELFIKMYRYHESRENTIIFFKFERECIER